MDTLKVCVSRIITCLAESFKACLHQRAYTAAENCLLAKKVCFCFCTESCFQNTGSCSADSESIGKRHIKSFSCGILLNSYQTRNTLAGLILASYRMTRSFWSDHRNVYILRRHNTSIMDIESMSKHQHIAFLKIRLNIVFVKSSLLLIVDEDHNNICLFCCLCRCIYFKSLLLSLFPGSAAFIQTNDNMAS